MRRNAGVFVAISLLSGFGGSAMSLVAGIWILDLTGSTSLAALAGLCVYAPVLAGPWLGAVVDRVPRRPLVIGVNLTLAAVLPALLAVRGPGQTWLIFAVSCAYGVSYVLIDAGETALLPSALSPSELGDVNGWRSSAQEGMKLVAPLAGAGLYAWRGGHAVVVLSAATPVLVALLYAAVRLRRTPPEGPSRPDRGLRAGLAVLARQRVTRVPVALAAVSIAVSGFSTAAIYAIVVSELRLPTTFLGVLASAQGAGSIAGGLVVGRLIRRRGPVGVGVAGTVLFALGCLARGLPWWPVTVGGAVLAGVGLPWTLVAAVTAVQTHTPTPLLGRVAATANTAMFGPLVVAIPLGSAAVHLGARPTLIAAVVICLTAAAAASRRPWRDGSGVTGWRIRPVAAGGPDWWRGLRCAALASGGPMVTRGLRQVAVGVLGAVLLGTAGLSLGSWYGGRGVTPLSPDQAKSTAGELLPGSEPMGSSITRGYGYGIVPAATDFGSTSIDFDYDGAADCALAESFHRNAAAHGWQDLRRQPGEPCDGWQARRGGQTVTLDQRDDLTRVRIEPAPPDGFRAATLIGIVLGAAAGAALFWFLARRRPPLSRFTGTLVALTLLPGAVLTWQALLLHGLSRPVWPIWRSLAPVLVPLSVVLLLVGLLVHLTRRVPDDAGETVPAEPAPPARTPAVGSDA